MKDIEHLTGQVFYFPASVIVESVPSTRLPGCSTASPPLALKVLSRAAEQLLWKHYILNSLVFSFPSGSKIARLLWEKPDLEKHLKDLASNCAFYLKMILFTKIF